jgi:hypothetical protein
MKAAGALAWSCLLRPEGVVFDGPRLSRFNTFLLLHVVQNVIKQVIFFTCTARPGTSGVTLVPESGILLFGLSKDTKARVLLIGALAPPGRLIEEISVIVTLRHEGAAAKVLEELVRIIPFIGCFQRPSWSSRSSPGILLLLLA